MSIKRCRIIGVPGAGKTTRGLELIKKLRRRGISLEQVGFCTFTRAARREASSRAAEVFGVSVDTLEKEGWFRTLHSSCMKLLGLPRGCIVNNDLDWLQEATGDDQLGAERDDEDSEAWTGQWKGKSPTAIALGLWDVARNRLVSFDSVYDQTVLRLGYVNGLDPGHGEGIIERYEEAKQKHDRLDFCDVVLHYAGYRMTLQGPERVEPEGRVPPTAAYIFDEAQDTSPLLDAAAQRLASETPWWYLLGDVNQGIYSWAGADPSSFMRWPVEHEEHLNKTWRCAAEVMNLASRLLYQEDELKTLAIEPRCEGGLVEVDSASNLHRQVDGRKPTLVLARTNQQAAKMMAELTAEQIPWRAVRGSQRWPPIASTRTCQAFSELEHGGVIEGDAWRRIVAAVPKELLVRGTKQRWKEASSACEGDFITLGNLEHYGALEELREGIALGKWPSLLKEGERESWAAQEKWGDLAKDPVVQVSTVHGSKGLEADHVVLHTGIWGPVLANLRTDAGKEEERRVWYVAVTRARDHLTLLADHRNNYTELLDLVLEEKRS